MATRARSLLVPTLLALAAAGPGCGGGGSSPPLGGVGDPCASVSRCQAGLVCFEGLCATEAPPSPSCAPAGHLPDLVDGGVLAIPQADYDEPGVDCVDAIRGASPDLDAVALDIHPVGTDLPFDIPAVTASFSIVSQESPGTANETVTLQGVEFPNAPVPTDVLFPDGGLFYDDMDSWFSDPSRYHALNAYAFGVAPQAGTFVHPSTSAGIDRLYTAGGVEAGTWRLTVNDYAYECLVSPLAPYCDAGESAAGRYDVTVLRKAGPIASTGTLDLSVILVSSSLTAADALASEAFQRYAGSLQALFGQAGICLGTVTVHDLPAWAVDRWGRIDADDGTPCGDLSQLFTTSPVANAVHVFLVDDLYSETAPPDSTVVGIDGSIPGPSGVSGTIVSGAAVELGSNLETIDGCLAAFDPESCDPDFVAYVTAHEAGHWLGLWHVTEAYATLWDPLDDTATCDCPCLPSARRTACANRLEGGEILPQYCLAGSPCGGGDNLMFWLYVDGVSAGSTSPQQGRVMRLNPAVR